MDLTLCEINIDTLEVIISSAKRHSFIQQGDELTMHSGDKRAIGGGEMDQIPFTNTKLQMKPGDALYLFSDGYPDQFGGPKRKKYRYRRFREKLMEIHQDSPEEQARALSTEFNQWIGDGRQVSYAMTGAGRVDA